MRRFPYVSLLAFAAALAVLFWALAQRQRSSDDESAPVAATSLKEADRIHLTTKDQRALHLPDGEVRIASLINVRRPMRFGQFQWNDKGLPAGPVWVLVDLQQQTMSVFRGENEIGTGVVLYGADSHPTPHGRFPILAKLKDHQSSIYEAEMPYTLRLTGDGVAIHGSNVRKGLATHGCVGIPSAFAAHVFDAVKVGDPVYIVDTIKSPRAIKPAV